MLASSQVAGLCTVLLRRPDSWRDVMLCTVPFLTLMRVLVEEQFRNTSSLLFRLVVRVDKQWVPLSRVEGLGPIELVDMGMLLTAGVTEVPDLARGSVVAVGRAPDRVVQVLGLVLVPHVADFIKDRVI